MENQQTTISTGGDQPESYQVFNAGSSPLRAIENTAMNNCNSSAAGVTPPPERMGTEEYVIPPINILPSNLETDAEAVDAPQYTELKVRNC